MKKSLVLLFLFIFLTSGLVGVKFALSQSYNAPIVTTNSASNIYESSATLNGQVNSNGYSAVYYFEYGTNSNFGSNTSYQSIGNGGGNFSVSQSISSLYRNTTYYYRLVAYNSYGTDIGETMTFVTGDNYVGCANGGYCYNNQSVLTQNATNVNSNSATLNGYVNGSVNGIAWFEYGNYSESNLNLSSSPTNINGYSNFSSNLYNLNSGTTYYYRAVVKNGERTIYGQTLSFVTGSNYINNYLPNYSDYQYQYVPQQEQVKYVYIQQPTEKVVYQQDPNSYFASTQYGYNNGYYNGYNAPVNTAYSYNNGYGNNYSNVPLQASILGTTSGLNWSTVGLILFILLVVLVLAIVFRRNPIR